MVVVTELDLKNQRTLLESVAKEKPMLFFDDFVKSLSALYEDVELPDFVKIPRDMPELLRGNFTPKYEIDLRPHKESILYKNSFRMWRNISSREFSLHGLGLIDNDKTKPCVTELYDTSPHKFLGGATGHGKSVALNALIMAGALVHPPWRAQFYLNDPKILEFKPFATAKRILPHVNTVAATTDPQYTISMLEYLIKVMNNRNIVFTTAGVKSIDSFNKTTGLSMPMLILVLDECRAMYLNAAKKRNHIDNLLGKFVALARNAGGRAILTSQEPVDEMSSSIMKNINIRTALGCQPDVSVKTIGNPAASRNQGQKGKLVVNVKPGDANIKDNIYIASPFIPDYPTEDSIQLAEIFAEIAQQADEIGYARTEPLSFFDEQEFLTKSEFLATVNDNASLTRFFLGEPAFIYKNEFKLYSTSMEIVSEFDTNESMNFLAISPMARMRFNMVATILANLTKVPKAKVLLRTTIRLVTDKVRALGYPITQSVETSDVSEQLFSDVVSVYSRYLAVTVDTRVFENRDHDTTSFHSQLVTILNPTNDLLTKRVGHILDMLLESKTRGLLKLPDLTEKTFNTYVDCAKLVYDIYIRLGAESKKVEAHDFAPVFFVYFDFDKINGVEIKPQVSLLERFFDVIKIAPIYRIYFFIVSAELPGATSSLAPAFFNLLLYSIKQSTIGLFKLTDEYPDTVGDLLWVYVNKKLPSNVCFKIKFPDLVGMSEENDSPE